MDIRKAINLIRKDKLFANSFWLMLNTVVLTALGFFFWTVIARFYPPTEVGLATTLISAMNLIITIAGLGLGVALVRFLPSSKDPNKSINTTILVSTLVSIAISALFVILIGVFSPKLSFVQESFFYGLFFIFSVVTSLLFTVLDNIFLSYNVSYYTVIKSTIFSVIKIILPPFLVAFGVIGIFGSWVLGTVVALVVAIYILMSKKLYQPKLEIHENLLQEILPFSFGNYLANLVRLLPSMVFPLFITELLNPESTAYYYTAFMVAGLLNIIPNATSSAVLAEGSKNPEAYNESEKKAMAITFALLIPSAIVMFILSDFIMLLLGKAYSDNAAGLLRIFCFASFLVAINYFYGTKLNIEKRVGAIIVRNIIIVGVTFASWYFFFLNMGLNGIGWAWTAGMATTLPMYIWEKFKK